jgi:hypothetical protein
MVWLLLATGVPTPVTPAVLYSVNKSKYLLLVMSAKNWSIVPGVVTTGSTFVPQKTITTCTLEMTGPPQ